MSRRNRRKADPVPGLTPRQLEILTLIRDAKRNVGYSPTLQEIADQLGISKITVFEHVGNLVDKGVLNRRSNKARSLELTALARLPDDRPAVLPLVGRIAAGQPIEAVETPDTVDLEQVFASQHPVAILTVAGDSMVEDGINDGDWVVYEQRSDARNGDTVVALVEGEATLKRFYKEKNRVRLQPANDAYEPIFAREIDIQGVVIGLLRRY